MAASSRIIRYLLPALAGCVVGLGILWLALSAAPSPAGAAGCWKGAITEQWTNLDLAGSVLRVAVQGRGGLTVVVRAKEGGFETSNQTGTKPEYGPNVAEFAPLSRGTYIVEPQGLGLAFEVWLDGHNYTRIDFTSKGCQPTPTSTVQPPTPTRTPRVTATPTRRAATTAVVKPTATTVAPGAPSWRARVLQQVQHPDMWLATILVRVRGQPSGQQVEIRSDGFSARCTTGTKPEYGGDACEFGALSEGSYTLTPLGLDISFPVSVAHNYFYEIEFYSVGGPVIDHWVGSVRENTSGSTPSESTTSSIAVIVTGRPWLEVEIRANDWTATCVTGYKAEYGADACEFGGLRAGTYTLAPKGLNVSVHVTMDGLGWALVQFDPVYAGQPPARPPAATPAAPTATPTPTAAAAGPRWRGWVVSNSSGSEPKGISSVIVVRVLGRGGVPVTITGGGDWSATCTTGTKPEYGGDACEFGGLWAATYYLRPAGADAEVSVTMDGAGIAFVDFQGP